MTYAGLACVFVALSAAVALFATLRCGLTARWWLTTGGTIAVLVVLTVVFDSLMILTDLFRFDESSLLGVRLWLAPVEDLAWPVVAGLVLPAADELLGAREVRS
ncbi:lycopene cyclase [Janibacter sp. DB-40]|uniref:lycopene cyclase n=1 Tax=Janibacter sp. DB-40 TaxID=3028808 RepID=UPI0024068CA4|nr:lycopene cyclase [Janibacter sp. DB-40]